MTNALMPQLSWTAVNLFLQCRRCFYKVYVLKMKKPGIDPDSFTLNNTVDLLWKREFDHYRSKKMPHPIMTKNKIEAIPFAHESLNTWRNYKAGGIRHVSSKSGIEIYGVIDDVWINQNNELIVVDYKATAKHKQFMTYYNRNKWNGSNKQQMAFYANLFKKNGFKVHNTGYFIYSTARNDMPLFDQKLDFESTLIACEIDDSWVDRTISDLRNCLDLRWLPMQAKDCDFCKYSPEINNPLVKNEQIHLVHGHKVC